MAQKCVEKCEEILAVKTEAKETLAKEVSGLLFHESSKAFQRVCITYIPWSVLTGFCTGFGGGVFRCYWWHSGHNPYFDVAPSVKVHTMYVFLRTQIQEVVVAASFPSRCCLHG